MNKFSLDKEPKITSGFIAPPDYFENFSAIVLEKTEAASPKKDVVISITKFYYAAAAVLVLALSIPFFWENSSAINDNVDTITLENYLAYGSGVTSYDLINLMDIAELDAMEVHLALEDESVEEILTSSSNFENYILD